MQTEDAMKTYIKIFGIYEGIAAHHGITQVAWAKAAGDNITQPRIAELSAMLRHIDDPDYQAKIGRACTSKKLRTLYRGLAKLIGGGTLIAETLREAERMDDSVDKMLLLSIAFQEASKESVDKAVSFMETVLQAEAQKRR